MELCPAPGASLGIIERWVLKSCSQRAVGVEQVPVRGQILLRESCHELLRPRHDVLSDGRRDYVGSVQCELVQTHEEVAGVFVLAGRQGADLRLPVRGHLDEALGDETCDRFSDRRPRHPEPGCELVVIQPLTREQGAVFDGGAATIFA